MCNIDELIKKYNESRNEMDKDLYLFEIKKIHPNYKNIWSNDDKKIFINEINKNNNLTLQ